MNKYIVEGGGLEGPWLFVVTVSWTTYNILHTPFHRIPEFHLIE
jgi:hypothetical protein